MNDEDLVARYQLEADGILVLFETKESMIRFIQTELPQDMEYETRTVH